MIFLKVILPIFVVGGSGYAVAKVFGGDLRSFSKIVMWIFSSVLTFTFVNEHVPKWTDISRFFVAFMLIFALNYTVYRVLIKSPNSDLFFLGAIFGNTGYMGYPVLQMAFGEEAVGYGVLYSVISISVVSTLGVALMSRNFKESMRNLLNLPFIYALILALILGYSGVCWKDFPEPFYSSLAMLKRAGIPVIIVFMGASMVEIEWKMENVRFISLTSLYRLVVVPLMALILSTAFGFEGLFKRVFVVESAMPVAMNSVVIASELRKNPEIMSSIVSLSTLLSSLTLAMWIYISGVIS